MKVAVTVEDDQIIDRFDDVEYFQIYEIVGNRVVDSLTFATEESEPTAIADFLKIFQIDFVVCCGISTTAQEALSSIGIKIFGGMSGNADQAIGAFLRDVVSSSCSSGGCSTCSANCGSLH